MNRNRTTPGRGVRWTTICVATFLAVSLIACKKKGSAARFPVKGLPKTPSAMGKKSDINIGIFLNIKRLRSTAVWKALVKSPEIAKLSNSSRYKEITGTCMVDPFKHIDRLGIGFADTKAIQSDDLHADRVIATVKGDLKAGKLISCLHSWLFKNQKEGRTVKKSTVEGKPAVIIEQRKGKELVYIFAAASDTVVLTGKPFAKAKMATHPYFKSARLAKMLKPLGQKLLVAIAVSEIAVPKKKLADLPPMFRAAASIKGLVIAADKSGKGFDVIAHAITKTPATAEALKEGIKLLKGLAAAMGGEKGKKKDDTAELLDKLKIRNDLASVQLGLTIPGSVVTRLIAEMK